MQYIQQILDSLSYQNNIFEQPLPALLFFLVGGLFLGGMLHILHGLAAFLNPISSRATPLFLTLFSACTALATLLYFRNDWVALHFPQGYNLIGGGTIIISCALFTVAAAKLVRYALVTCAWGTLCLVLSSFVVFKQAPHLLIKNHLPHVQNLIAQELIQSRPMRDLGW